MFDRREFFAVRHRPAVVLGVCAVEAENPVVGAIDRTIEPDVMACIFGHRMFANAAGIEIARTVLIAGAAAERMTHRRFAIRNPRRYQELQIAGLLRMMHEPIEIVRGARRRRGSRATKGANALVLAFSNRRCAYTDGKDQWLRGSNRSTSLSRLRRSLFTTRSVVDVRLIRHAGTASSRGFTRSCAPQGDYGGRTYADVAKRRH